MVPGCRARRRRCLRINTKAKSTLVATQVLLDREQESAIPIFWVRSDRPDSTCGGRKSDRRNGTIYRSSRGFAEMRDAKYRYTEPSSKGHERRKYASYLCVGMGIHPPRYALIGSITMSRTSGCSRSTPSKIALSVSRLNGFSVSEPSMRATRTASRMCTRDTSAPAASRRGRIVSAASSSALRKITLPDSHGAPSRKGLPRVTREATSVVRSDFPRPGSPMSSVSFPEEYVPARAKISVSGRCTKAAQHGTRLAWLCVFGKNLQIIHGHLFVLSATPASQSAI